MRVAWLMTDYPKNSQTFNRQEIVSLEQHGVEVVPIAVNPPDESDLDRPEDRRESERTLYLKRIPKAQAVGTLAGFMLAHPIASLRAVRLALGTTGTDPRVVFKRMLHLAEAMLVLRHCRSQGVSHIHAQFGGTASTIAMLAAETGCLIDGANRFSFSCTLHGLDVWNDPPWLLGRKVSRASAIICAADFTRSQVLRVSAPADWSKVCVVRCGIDLDRFPAREKRPSSTPLRVVTIGRLAPEKGLTVLLEAMQRLQESGPEVALTVIGGGPEEAALRDFVTRNGLGSRVALLGEQSAERVPELLREADVLCLPSFAEGVPLAIVEAMATGVAVVSTQIGGIPEMVVDGKTGVCVPAGRSDLLAEGIASLAKDPERSHALSIAARRRVEDLYDVRKTTRHLLETIQAAAGGSGAGA